MAYKLSFYVPPSHLEAVKQAVFEAGGGELANYKQCAWQVLGEGQFFPNEKANPFLGSTMTLSKEPEYKVEIYCRDEVIEKAIKALISTHPYEEPAYDVIRLSF